MACTGAVWEGCEGGTSRCAGAGSDVLQELNIS